MLTQHYFSITNENLENSLMPLVVVHW